MKKINKVPILLILVLGIGLAITMPSNAASVATIATNSGIIFPDSSPIQNGIKQSVINGTISKNDLEGSPEYTTQVLEKNDSHIKLKSTTKVIFKNPRGAGYGNNRWPIFGDNGIVGEEKVKRAILSDIQNISDKKKRSAILAGWKKYNFEYGERVYVINETYDVTYKKANSSFVSISSVLTNSLSANDILMGFTQEMPEIKHEWQQDLYIPITVCLPFVGCYTYYEHVATFTAGVNIGGAFGLRLPTEVNLNIPNPMYAGNSYVLSTSINGADWDANKYSSVNVYPENGNEFVARYSVFLGAKMWLIGYGDVDCSITGTCIDSNLDYGKSFPTPIGTNQRFPLPVLELSPDITGLKYTKFGASIGIGLKISPDLSTQDIIASWTTKGDSIGTGYVDYHAPNTNYNFGPVNAGEYDSTTNLATIRLSDYKYYFSSCKLSLHGRIQTGGWLPFIATDYYPLYAVDCSGLTQGLYLGIHSGTTADHVEGSALVQPIASVSLPRPQ